MPKFPSVATAKSRLAVSTRWHPHQDQTELRRDLAAAKLEAYVSRVVAEAPPLTAEQLDRVAVLLRPGGGAS